MTEVTLQDMIEQAVRQVARSSAFLELAQLCPHAELHFQIHNGRCVSGDLRVKVRRKPKRSPTRRHS